MEKKDKRKWRKNMNGYKSVCAVLIMLAMFFIVPAIGVEANVEAISTAEASVSVTQGDHVSVTAEAETKVNNNQMSVESTVSGKGRDGLKASVSTGFSPREGEVNAQIYRDDGYGYNTYVVWSEADIGTPKSEETRKLDLKSESEAFVRYLGEDSENNKMHTNADVDTNGHAVRDATGHIETSAEIDTNFYDAETKVDAEIEMSGRQVDTHVDADISSVNTVLAGIDADIDGKGELHTDVDKTHDKRNADVDGSANLKKGNAWFDLFVGTIFGSTIYG